jgi:hypothetical protein
MAWFEMPRNTTTQGDYAVVSAGRRLYFGCLVARKDGAKVEPCYDRKCPRLLQWL